MQVLGKGKEFLVGEWESVAWRRGSRLRLCCQPSYCCGQLELHPSTEDGTLRAQVKHTILISSVVGWGLLLGDVNCQATSSMPHRYRIRAGFCRWRKPRGREPQGAPSESHHNKKDDVAGGPLQLPEYTYGRTATLTPGGLSSLDSADSHSLPLSRFSYRTIHPLFDWIQDVAQ